MQGTVAIMDVSGKVALITGAAEGLGRAFTEELLKKHIKAVGILDIQQTKGETTLKHLTNEYGDDKVHFIQCDVADKQQFEGAFSEIKNRFGQIDLVCNNAGIANEDTWEKMIEINLTAVTRGTHLAVKYMSKENGGKGGVIINIASLAGITPEPFIPVYTATKHGVVGLSRSLAINPKIKAENIRINALCPAAVDTAILQKGQPYGITKEERTRTRVAALIPMSVVAEAFMKLVEEDLNGQVMRVTNANGIELQEYEEIQL